MAFPVSSRSTGTLITATIWNSDIRDNVNALYGGSLSVLGQAAWDFLYASSPTQIGRMAAVVNAYPKFVSGIGWQMNVPTAGWHNGFIPASAITPHSSNPCGWHERITLTHGVYWALQFSGVADNWASVNVRIPKSWDEANFTIAPVWLSLSPTGGNVSWIVYGNSISNGETGNWSAAAGGSIVQANYGQYLITSAGAMAFGPASVISEDNFMSMFIIRQSSSSGADTFPDPAYLLGLAINVYTNNDNDN